MEHHIDEAAWIRMFDVLGLPAWVSQPGRMGAGRLLSDMHQVADAADAERTTSGPRDVPDLLDRLMAADDPETGRRKAHQNGRENLLTFIAAGHETTAVTLAWAPYLMAFDPDTQSRASAEARARLGDRAAEDHDMAGLKLTRAAIEETLRLYP